MLDYETFFGYADPEKGIEVVFDNSGPRLDVKARINEELRSKYLMYYSLQMFFINGGGPCWIVSIGDYPTTGGLIMDADLKRGLAEVEKINEVTLLLFPDAINLANEFNYYALHDEAIDQCTKLQDRFVIMDVHHSPDSPDWQTDIDNLRNTLSGTTDDLKYAAVYFPKIRTGIDFYAPQEDQVKIIGKSIALPETMTELKSTSNANYFMAKAAIADMEMLLPASPAMAGIYALVDATRGVWKAPANVNIDNAIGPEFLITHEQQKGLNVDAVAGKSINVIRSFAGRGPAIVWGARTLAGNDNEWRYIPVRRYFNMVEESTKNATEQFVFEPNDINTWVRVKSMIANYLTQQWKAGALQGASTKEAFFVHVGLDETMTYQDILEGRMIVEIGMAVVRPAEFIILRFMHKMLGES